MEWMNIGLRTDGYSTATTLIGRSNSSHLDGISVQSLDLQSRYWATRDVETAVVVEILGRMIEVLG